MCNGDCAWRLLAGPPPCMPHPPRAPETANPPLPVPFGAEGQGGGAAVNSPDSRPRSAGIVGNTQDATPAALSIQDRRGLARPGFGDPKAKRNMQIEFAMHHTQSMPFDILQ